MLDSGFKYVKDKASPFISCISCGLFTLLMTGTSAIAANNIALSHTPIFEQSLVPPNVFYMLDDSGSMDFSILVANLWDYKSYWGNGEDKRFNNHGQWKSADSQNSCESIYFAYLYNNTENIYDLSGDCRHGNLEDHPVAYQFDWRVRSSAVNRMYYDPSVTYFPWSGFPEAEFDKARAHPVEGQKGYDEIRNLGASGGAIYEVAIDTKGYKVSDGPSPLNFASEINQANGEIDLWDDHIQYKLTSSEISAKKYSYRTSLFSVCDQEDPKTLVPYQECLGAQVTSVPNSDVLAYGRTLEEEQQNFANWYQYHRKRHLAMKYIMAKVTNSFSHFQYGMSFINNYNGVFIEVPKPSENRSEHNANLISQLFNYQQKSSGTPLRKGLEKVGQYYDHVSRDYDDPIINACQQNFAFLVSDGYWSGDDPTEVTSDVDGDGKKVTLADVARHYYLKDLSPLPNDVPIVTDANTGEIIDAADWQHMNTFGIAFGINGTLKDLDLDGWPDESLAVDGNWGDPFDSATQYAARADDMWHAAFNSAGRFLSAQTPPELLAAIEKAMASIGSRRGSGSKVSLNSGTLFDDSRLFQAEFNFSDYSGDLLVKKVEGDTGELGSTLWSAGDQLAALGSHNNRQIISYNPETGKQINFRWSKLSDNQKKSLLKNHTTTDIDIATDYGMKIVDYLRGDFTHEYSTTNQSGLFRARNGKRLGTIVHSSPTFVGNPSRFYNQTWGGTSAPENIDTYANFKSSFESNPRSSVVYVGANDGMVHGFNVENGKELFAYVPNLIMDNLADYAEPNAGYLSYVDGEFYAQDVYFNSGTSTGWRTLLAGGLRFGAQGVFALDVTQVDEIKETSGEGAATLWEFGDAQDADVGFVYAQPAIGRMADGNWAVIFGNGYNNTLADGSASSSGSGILYIVHAQTGELIRKLDTGAGSINDPSGKNRPNALGEPAVVDIDQDGLTDFIYVGDSFGNLWKFDVRSAAPSVWKSSFISGTGKPAPLYVARSNLGIPQPINVKPTVMKHPKSGYLIHFGTGQYLTAEDAAGMQDSPQSMYAIWDNGNNGYTRGDLLKQSIIDQTTQDGYTLRITSDHLIEYEQGENHMGWFMDLQFPAAMSSGERIISDPILRNGEILFATFEPSLDGCSGSSKGSIMMLDALSGSRLKYNTLLDENDQPIRVGEVIPSGVVVNTGGPTGVVVANGLGKDSVYTGTTERDIVELRIESAPSVFGRQTWRRISNF